MDESFNLFDLGFLIYKSVSNSICFMDLLWWLS